MSLFFKIFGMVFFAELGDKTQFLMIAMASKYRLKTILLGVGAAICALNVMAIVVGTLVGGFLPTAVISIVAGIAFLCFAYMSVGENKAEKDMSARESRGGFFEVFGTFFLAELGDKTQLTALTLAAEYGSGGFDLSRVVAVFAGASAALLLADILGLVVGIFLGKRLPDTIFSWISFVIFSVFGAIKLIDGSRAAFLGAAYPLFAAIALTSMVCVIFAAIVMKKVLKTDKKGKIKVKDSEYGKEKNNSEKLKPL